jgi:hypothetical protein
MTLAPLGTPFFRYRIPTQDFEYQAGYMYSRSSCRVSYMY